MPSRLQEIMVLPCKRIREYMNLLAALQLHTPREHLDQSNISSVLNDIRSLYLNLKQIQERVDKKQQIVDIQRQLINMPVKMIFLIDVHFLLILDWNFLLLLKEYLQRRKIFVDEREGNFVESTINNIELLISQLH